MDVFGKIKSHRFILSFITLSALLIRLIGINKPYGLWHDELTGYCDSLRSFPFEILQALNRGLHPPLYFFTLHFWLKIFGSEEIIARLFSVVAGTLIIPAMYLVGKEISSRKVGLLAAAFACVNSLLVYYSQEVRIYSLFALFSVLSILFLIKVIKNPVKKNYIGMVIANLCCLYTSSLALVYLSIQIFVLFIYLLFFEVPVKRNIKLFFYAQLATLVLYLPNLITLVHSMKIVNGTFVGIFNFAKFTPACILFVIQDWFSPVIINLTNHPHGYYEYILSQGAYLYLILLILLPVMIIFSGIIMSFREKNRVANILFLTALLLFGIQIMLTIFGKAGLISRYTITIMPILLAVAAYGFSVIKNKKVLIGLISLFLAINSYYLVFSSQSAARMARHEGFGSVAKILGKYNINQKDLIIMPYGGKYFNMAYDPQKKYHIVYLDYLDIYFLKERSCSEKVFDEYILNSLDKINTKNAYAYLRPYIGSPDTSPAVRNFIKRDIVAKLEKGGRLVVVNTTGLNIFSNSQLQQIATVDSIYNDQSLTFMLSSKIANDILSASYENLNPVALENEDSWEIHILEKK